LGPQGGKVAVLDFSKLVLKKEGFPSGLGKNCDTHSGRQNTSRKGDVPSGKFPSKKGGKGARPKGNGECPTLHGGDPLKGVISRLEKGVIRPGEEFRREQFNFQIFFFPGGKKAPRITYTLLETVKRNPFPHVLRGGATLQGEKRKAL